MDQTPQSEFTTDSSLPKLDGIQRPLAAVALDRSSDLTSTVDKAPAMTPQPVAASHAKFSDDVHGYIRESIRNADQKATFFFAALTAILAFLNTQNVPARWMKSVAQWSFVDTLGFVSMLGLAAGAATLLAVVFPRLKGSRRGLLFFNAISEYDNSGEYANDVLACSGDDLVRKKLLHCHELSRICTAKYRVLRVGFWMGCVGVASSLLFLLLSKG